MGKTKLKEYVYRLWKVEYQKCSDFEIRQNPNGSVFLQCDFWSLTLFNGSFSHDCQSQKPVSAGVAEEDPHAHLAFIPEGIPSHGNMRRE